MESVLSSATVTIAPRLHRHYTGLWKVREVLPAGPTLVTNSPRRRESLGCRCEVKPGGRGKERKAGKPSRDGAPGGLNIAMIEERTTLRQEDVYAYRPHEQQEYASENELQHLQDILQVHDFMLQQLGPAIGGRKTKIVATIGPTSNTRDTLFELADHGMNVCRLNMSHGDHGSHKQVMDLVREYNSLHPRRALATMLDTKGPEVRSGDLQEPFSLKPEDYITFTIDRQGMYAGEIDLREGEYITSVNYDGFVKDVHAGDDILVDGGLLTFRVEEVRSSTVRCRVRDGGVFKSRRHLNVRGRSANLPSITDKDWDDINFGIEQGMDYVALSFVKDAAVVNELKAYLRERLCPMQVIAKIESAASVENLDDILDACDGVMVARGDLGSELPIEEVPVLQSYMVARCREMGKPVIVATQMLESMITNPRPTRAEVSDIAIAVREGADAVMLSGETAFGAYPLKSMLTMSQVAMRNEGTGDSSSERVEAKQRAMVTSLASEVIAGGVSRDSGTAMAEVFAYHTVVMANMLNAYVVVFTRTGSMATLLSRNRPRGTIFAFTDNLVVQRRLALSHGVTALYVPFGPDADVTFEAALDVLREEKLARPGELVVFVKSGRHSIWRAEDTHTIQLRSIPDVEPPASQVDEVIS